MTLLLGRRQLFNFLSKEGIRAKSINDRLKAVYGNHTISYRSVRRWVEYFSTGATDLNDKHRSGRPSSAATQKNKIRVNEMIQNDRRVTVLDIMNELEIGSSVVQHIINELGYSKVCARWVPRQLTQGTETEPAGYLQRIVTALSVRRGYVYEQYHYSR
jgi:transposase